MKNEFTYEDLAALKEIVLYQRLLDPKRRAYLTTILDKIVAKMYKIDEDKDKSEDEIDAKYRKKIVK